MKRKEIVSADGLLSVPFDDVTHACMTGSIHALLQYLMLFDYDIVAKHTCYFLGYGVSPEVSAHLPAYYFNTKQTGTVLTPSRWFDKISMRLGRNRNYPFLKKSEIFAMDVGFVPPLIGKQPYALLSDGPLGISQNMQVTSAEYQRQIKKKHSLQGRLEELLYGPVAVFGWGNNPQCREFYLTEENNAVVLEGKPVHVRSLRQMWESASRETRQLVLNVYGIDDNDIRLLNSKRYMFLTQPFTRDRTLTDEEYCHLLQRVFSHYDTSQLLLKLHPRDNFDYQKYFPDITVYDKKVNMQLLVLLGATVERAITICSSSVNSFPESVPVDWFGVDIHPKLKSFFGEMVPPYRSYNQVSL